MATALVFGANGISGIALLEALSATSSSEWAKIIAVSRRPPVLEHKDPRIVFESIDLLTSPKEIAAKLKHAGAAEATHAFFYSYVAKEDEKELIDINERLFRNVNYGTHKGGKYLRTPQPWKEDMPRHEVQIDILKEESKKHGWSWIVTVPNGIVGFSKCSCGSAVTVALYAVGRKALGDPLVFPGTTPMYNATLDCSAAHNNAAFQIFVAKNEKAKNRMFNIHDGTKQTWAKLWPEIAEYFNIPLTSPPAEDPPAHIKVGTDVCVLHPSTEWAKQHAADFEKIVREHNLQPDSFKYATWDFLDFYAGRTWPDDASMDAAKEIGWDRKLDSFKDGFKLVFDKLKEEKIIPA
ncbi:SPOSA6832_04552, partial [Sporobolomyces salmonicolor]